MMAVNKRECGPCTRCCEGWLQLNVNGVAVGINTPCMHSTVKGCAIYKRRPKDPCKLFRCGWLKKQKAVPDWMRPDLSGVILDIDKYEWQGGVIDVATIMGEVIQPRTIEYLENYVEKFSRNLILTQLVKRDVSTDYNTDITVLGAVQFKQHIGDLIRTGRFNLNEKRLSK